MNVKAKKLTEEM